MKKGKFNNHNHKSSKKPKIIKCHIKNTTNTNDVLDTTEAPIVSNDDRSQKTVTTMSAVAVNDDNNESIDNEQSVINDKPKVVNTAEPDNAPDNDFAKALDTTESKNTPDNDNTKVVIDVPVSPADDIIKLFDNKNQNGTTIIREELPGIGYIDVEIEDKNKGKSVYYPPALKPSSTTQETEDTIKTINEKLRRISEQVSDTLRNCIYARIKARGIVSDLTNKNSSPFSYSYGVTPLGTPSIGYQGARKMALDLLNDWSNPWETLYKPSKRAEKNTPNICYNFNFEMLLRAFLYSEDFREAVMSGKYIYHDERLWLFRSDVICKKGDTIELSEKALLNPDYYSLGLKIDVFKSHTTDRQELLNSYDKSYTSLFSNIELILQTLDEYGLNIAAEELSDKFEEIKSLLMELQENFSEALGKQYESVLLAVKAGKGAVADDLEKGFIEEDDDTLNKHSDVVNGKNRNKDKNNTITTKKEKTKVESDFIELKKDVSDIIHAAEFNKDIPYTSIVGDAIMQTLSYVNEKNIENSSYLSFSSFFSKLIDDKNLSLDDVFALTGIPARTITRMKSNNDKYRPTLEYIIIFCVAMKLTPMDSIQLLYLAGYILRPNVRKERFYIAFIYVLYREGSIDICDMLLSKYELPTLTSYIKKNKKESQ